MHDHDGSAPELDMPYDEEALEIVSDVGSFSTDEEHFGAPTLPADDVPAATRSVVVAASCVAYLALVVLNVSMQRQLGGMEEAGMGSRRFYNIIGAALLVGCVGACCVCCPARLDKQTFTTLAVYAVSCWVVSAALCWTYPNQDWAEYFVVSAGENLAAEAERTCTAAAASELSRGVEAVGPLPAYVALVGGGWSVAASDATYVTTRAGEVFAVAKILCDGAGDLGIHAVCALPAEEGQRPEGGALVAQCGWAAGAAATHIRRATAAPAFRDASLFLEPGPFESAALFEWKAPTLAEARAFVAAVDTGDRRQYIYAPVAWVLLTLPSTVASVLSIFRTRPLLGVTTIVSQEEL